MRHTVKTRLGDVAGEAAMKSSEMLSYLMNIDLCPYTVDLCNDGIRIVDIGNTVLKKLDNRVSVTGNRFSADRSYTTIGPSYCWLQYEELDGVECLRIEPCDGYKVPTFDELVDWLAQNYDRIQSIGWGMLEEP